MEEKKLVPKRRFRGFDGEWEATWLKDCVEYVKGFAFKSKDYRKNGTRLIRVSDLGYKKISYNNNSIFLSKKFEEKYKEYRLYKEDIIITTVGSQAELKESAVGRSIMVKDENQGLLNQNLVKLTTKNEFLPYFIYKSLSRTEYADFISTIERGNANQANITLEELLTYTINHGLYEEQQKIGEFFKVLDERIANQERKISKVKALKEAYLTEMFPQEGEIVPKRRFKGFEGEWKEDMLYNISEIIAGGDIKKDRISKKGKYPVFANTFINDGIVGYYVNEYRVKAPAVTVTGRGSIGFAKARFKNFTPVIRLLSIKSDLDVYFLEQVINNLHIVVESTGVPQLTVPQLGSLKVKFPIFSEQQKIGSFFKNLDDQIRAEEAKLEKLKKMKEAYLEEMFV